MVNIFYHNIYIKFDAALKVFLCHKSEMVIIMLCMITFCFVISWLHGRGQCSIAMQYMNHNIYMTCWLVRQLTFNNLLIMKSGSTTSLTSGHSTGILMKVDTSTMNGRKKRAIHRYYDCLFIIAFTCA